MARTVSWIPRLPALLRSVQDSVRSHYSSRDLEKLFEIQPRSAQMLSGLLPTVRVGRTLLVEREALLHFLQRLDDAEDPASELNAIRSAPKPPLVRRKLRDLVRRDVDTSSLPSNMKMAIGMMTVHFQTVEQLAQSLWRLAQILDEDLDGFADRYEPKQQPTEDIADQLERHDASWIAQWLADHERPIRL